MARIESVERLRQIVGEPRAATPWKITEHLQPEAIAFIRRSPFLVMSTVRADGRPDLSPKGDEPGFVRVVDDRTLLVPERPGNKLVFGLQNLLADPRVALLFLVPGSGETLRVGGTAELLEPSDTDDMTARGKAALLV